MYLCIRVFVYLCILHLIHRNVIFDILESYAFKNIVHVVSSKHFVFVYLCISHLIHGSVIFNIPESYVFFKNIAYVGSSKHFRIWRIWKFEKLALLLGMHVRINTRAPDGANKMHSFDLKSKKACAQSWISRLKHHKFTFDQNQCQVVNYLSGFIIFGVLEQKMVLNIKWVAGNINDICTKRDKEVSNTIKMISA